MISTGVVDHDLLQLKIGEVSHSRWLTTGNRFGRLWVFKHGFKGAILKTLRVIVVFLIGHYFSMWFVIKSTPCITAGPHHKLKEIQLIAKMKGKDERSRKVKSIAMKFVEKGAWHAHSENSLVSLLKSSKEEDRRFAVGKILEIRDGAPLGDQSAREFIPPKLNWNATSIQDMQDWTKGVMGCELTKANSIYVICILTGSRKRKIRK